jgi:hypothetical protein
MKKTAITPRSERFGLAVLPVHVATPWGKGGQMPILVFDPFLIAFNPADPWVKTFLILGAN